MSIRNLTYLFEPKSVAVIGASSKPNSVGATVLNNLVASGFAGPVLPVNPKQSTYINTGNKQFVFDLNQAHGPLAQYDHHPCTA